MRTRLPLTLTMLLAACGGGGGASSSGGGTSAPTPTPVVARGALVGTPANVPVSVNGVPLAKLDPTVFTAMLEAGQPGTTVITGVPRCTVTLNTVKYNTVGANGEATDASAAIMVPSGADAKCTGARPVLLYAHATTVEKTFDMTNLNAYNEARLVAAMFAAQGYIVVAPNYTGYAGSSLAYHPYLVADAQANDMADALRAARLSFAGIGANASARLFITGYSQGGHAALATQRAMQTRFGSEFTVAAVSGMSGPYALIETGDAIFGGKPTSGVTTFLPLLINAGQRANATLYTSTGDIYETPFAAGIDNLLPSARSLSELVGSGKLPATVLFAKDSLPQASGSAVYFGDNNLVKSSYRKAYLDDAAAHPCGASAADPLNCAPANFLRKFMLKNDLRSYVPGVPLMLCGGDQDPTVPYQNTVSALAYFRAGGLGPARLTEVNLDATVGLNDSYRNAKLGFQAAKAALAAAAVKAGSLADQAVQANYHAGLVAPFCIMATRDYFDSLTTP
ncbi:MAG: prolyl oligopeptidase family serine peptidase [Pseudomonadota bacterium]